MIEATMMETSPRVAMDEVKVLEDESVAVKESRRKRAREEEQQ
jgi:hypothetical protein